MNATAFAITAKDRSKNDLDGPSDDLFENVGARGEQFVGLLCEQYSLRSGRTAKVNLTGESTISGAKATPAKSGRPSQHKESPIDKPLDRYNT